jgi:nitrogen regulatory protein PII
VDYQMITCIVERGRAETVADAALGAGAQGVTIYAARGRGVRERLMFLGYLIDPEKEVLITVATKKQAGPIFDTIVKAAKIDLPGKGFAFVQDVSRVAGFLTARNLPDSASAKPAARARRPAAASRRGKRGRAR